MYVSALQDLQGFRFLNLPPPFRRECFNLEDIDEHQRVKLLFSFHDSMVVL